MPLNKDTSTIAWIGTGVMGVPMAGHLMDGGWKVVVYNRTKAKAEPLLERGAQWADTPGEAAAQADVVFTIVGFPHDVRSIYLDAGGIMERARPGTILVDMTTSDPVLAVEIAEKAAARGLQALDCPVSGGEIGAKEARLSIMGGGDEQAFEQVRPLLELMGKKIVRHGGPGKGQYAKLANQILLAGQMVSVAEALVFARAVGLDEDKAFESLGAGAGAGYSFQTFWPKMVNGDNKPGFYVRHFIKDMDLALNESERLRLFTPALGLARLLYDRVVELGGEDLGTQAIYLALKDVG